MLNRHRCLLGVTLALAVLLTGPEASAQALPNPYRLVDGWAKLPAGHEMGAVGDVAVDPDGRHIWAVIRCDAGADLFGWECLDRTAVCRSSPRTVPTSSINGATRDPRPAMGRSSSPSIATAISTAANPVRARCRSTSG